MFVLSVLISLSVALEAPSLVAAADVCSAPTEATQHTRYLLYSVNAGEGFNLRRDVYIRFANLVYHMNKNGTSQRWVLVLPPWHRMYHWYNERSSPPADWSAFFDLASMNQYIPVIELNQYIAEVGKSVDVLYILQHYAEGWGSSWEEKFEERPCIEHHEFRDSGDDTWEGLVSGRLMKADRFSCLSMQGTAVSLVSLLNNLTAMSVALLQGETALHQYFAGSEYWQARRSMRFTASLEDLARQFRETALDTRDDECGLVRSKDWRKEKTPLSPTLGGPFLAVHLRRLDFVRAKRDQLPSLQVAALQLLHLIQELDLHLLFLATDAPPQEVSELTELLPGVTVLQYPESDVLTDGQLAVIDQITAARARHFIGSYESTFSYRIQEEREILGFPAASTFNRLCGSSATCEQPAKWTIVY